MKTASRVITVAALSFPLALGATTTALAATPYTSDESTVTVRYHLDSGDHDKKKDQENEGQTQNQQQILSNPQSNSNKVDVDIKGNKVTVVVPTKQENTGNNTQNGDWDDNTQEQENS